MDTKFIIERKKRGLTQRMLYEACGISAPTFQKLEENPKQFKIAEIEKIAVVFGCSVNEIIEIVRNESKIIPESIDVPTAHIPDNLRGLLLENNLTWKKLTKRLGHDEKNESNIKRNLEGWVSKINSVVGLLGYKVGYIKLTGNKEG